MKTSRTNTIQVAAGFRHKPVFFILFQLLIAFSCSTRTFAKCPTNNETIMVEIATYEEVKDLPNHPEKVLIDVREPNELQETGRIPTSINIPRKRPSFSNYKTVSIIYAGSW